MIYNGSTQDFFFSLTHPQALETVRLQESSVKALGYFRLWYIFQHYENIALFTYILPPIYYQNT